MQQMNTAMSSAITQVFPPPPFLWSLTFPQRRLPDPDFWLVVTPIITINAWILTKTILNIFTYYLNIIKKPSRKHVWKEYKQNKQYNGFQKCPNSSSTRYWSVPARILLYVCYDSTTLVNVCRHTTVRVGFLETPPLHILVTKYEEGAFPRTQRWLF